MPEKQSVRCPLTPSAMGPCRLDLSAATQAQSKDDEDILGGLNKRLQWP